VRATHGLRIAHSLRTIEELEQSLAIDVLIDEYEAEFGAAPLNVSHWNSSAEFRDRMAQVLRFEHESDPLSYIFSEAVECRDAILAKLGFDPDVSGCIITPNGTIATLCAANWIASAGFDETVVVCPTYFATLHQARLLQLRATKRYMLRGKSGHYELPPEVADLSQRSAPTWVTNPVYSTGVHLTAKDVGRLQAFLDSGGIVIADECMATPGTEIGPSLARNSGFMGIYSPHKSVSMNGLKFSLLVFDRRYTRFFQDWTDVLHGGLTASNMTAVKHFLSDNFAEYQRTQRTETDRTLDFVKSAIAECSGVETDEGAYGQFSTIYVPGLPADFDADRVFFATMIRCTAGTLIPGRRSHFDPSIGACFRINLARDSGQFRTTLVRIIRYLTARQTRDYFSSLRGG